MTGSPHIALGRRYGLAAATLLWLSFGGVSVGAAATIASGSPARALEGRDAIRSCGSDGVLLVALILDTLTLGYTLWATR